MASSRIFVKGLPPSITEEEFRKHFSAKQPITDAKLIAHRRIGYVGYKSPEDAVKAVKYFNRSFIRMSKLGVEIAKPISDISIPAFKKQALGNNSQSSNATPEKLSSTSSLKRKRDDVVESDPRLQEFLEVMQPTKSADWAAHRQTETLEDEPPLKIQAVQLPEAESDGEYEEIPTKIQQNLAPSVDERPVTTAAISSEHPSAISEIRIESAAETDTMPSALGGTDDDWLRSRTNRLLDLVELGDTNAEVDPPPNHVDIDVKEPETRLGGPEAPSSVPVEAMPEVDHGDDVNEIAPDASDQAAIAIQQNGRLFVRNLPYSATEDDLRKHFSSFGSLEEVHLPLDAKGTSKGFLLVQFADSAAAVEAYRKLDGSSFQGRLLHILPAAAKRENKLDEFEIAKLPLKKQKQIKKKAEASTTTFNWNSLYMNQDAVNSSVADRLGVSKSDLLDPTSSDAAVKQAIAETTVIQDTKAYFANNGVDVNAFRKRERGDTTILVKNFPFGMSIEELRKMFEEFGQVLRVLMPPTGTIAIVEFAQAPQARAAFASLAYRRVKDSVLFLEKAPKDLFTDVKSNDIMVSAMVKEKHAVDAKPSATDLLEKESGEETADSSTLFVRNLNFSTTSERLTEVFKPLSGFMSARVNTKADPKRPGQVLSMGFGFLEFRSKSLAQAALSAMDGYSLDGHNLIIKASHKGLDAAEERRREDRAKKAAGKRTKLVIKNLPFEASKKDVRALFGTYGQLRSVRVPKKFDSSARGFAFADFVTSREAENALEALKHTHFLGRRLVIDFAEEDVLDAEEEIAKMQEKVGKQVSKVALQRLTGGGRKKFNIEGNDENEEN